MRSRDFEAMIQGFSLTTAEILYRMPDHLSILQSYVWQDYDRHPEYPKLHKFLEFWSKNLEAPLFQVRVAHNRLISPREFRIARGEFGIQ